MTDDGIRSVMNDELAGLSWSDWDAILTGLYSGLKHVRTDRARGDLTSLIDRIETKMTRSGMRVPMKR